MNRSPSLALAVVVFSSILVSAVIVDRWMGRQLAAGPLEPVEVDDERRARLESKEAEEDSLREEANRLEQRLDEIERAIDRAQDRGERDRAKELRREGEDILDRLDELNEKLADDDEDRDEAESEEQEQWEREQLEMRMHQMRLELERAELELRAGQLEMVQRITRTAEQEVSAAVYGVLRAQEVMEPKEAVEFLQELLDEVGPVIVKRAIRMKLVELYRATDRPQDAKSQIRSLIVGD